MPHGLTVVPRRSPGGNPYSANILTALTLVANSRFLTECYLQNAVKRPFMRTFGKGIASYSRKIAGFREVHPFAAESYSAATQCELQDSLKVNN
jgi:hypothetical protein